MILRGYQEEAINSTLGAWQTHASVLGCMPTGSGKTVVASEIIKRRGGRALVLCHTGELVKQFAKSLWRFGLDSEIEKADMWAETQTLNGCPVVIATPQTLYSQNGKRLKRWSPDSFNLLIVDEAHHYSGAPAFEGVVKHFLANDELRCLALTATPDRHDGIALARICESVAFKYEIVDMIDQGYLVGVEQFLVKIESLDLSKCRTSAGDFNKADLAQIVEEEKVLLGMADATLKTVGEKKTLVFAHNVKQAERLAEIFNRYRPESAECVFGHTPEDKRAMVFRQFADKGRLQIMVNVAVAGEGYDNPNIEAVVCAKPTKSRARYTQNIGRGLRPLDGLLTDLNSPEERRMVIAASSKPHCIVLDFCGNSGRHSLMSVADVLGGSISEQAKTRAKAKILQAGRGNILDELSRAEKELRDEAERKKRAGIVADAKHRLTYVDPFHEFRQRAEKFKGYQQHNDQFTSKQRIALLRASYNPDDLSFADGKAILAKMFAASDGQMKVLLRYYTAEELEGVKKWEASKMIEAIKQAGWRKPNGH